MVMAVASPLYLQIGMGGLMGDRCEPELFMANVHESIIAWTRQTYRIVDRILVTKCALFEVGVNASLDTFIDDIFRFLLLPEEREAATISNVDSHDLNKHLKDRA